VTRDYELVLFGATGFTGGLVADHLAKYAGGSTRWAIAGRDRAKLETIRARLVSAHPRCDVGVVLADVGDPASLLAMARACRAVLSTVGPYIEYGEPVVRACVEAGTHHLDITGEPAFLALVEERYHESARAKGVRLIHCCGLDSIPADVGAFYTAKQLPAAEEKSVRGYLATNARPSGGTVHSALEAMSEGEVSLARRLMQPVGERSALPAIEARIHHVPELGAWAVPMPLVDAMMVSRSMKAHAVYGPRFQYGEFFLRDSLPSVAAVLTGVVGLILAAKAPPTRRIIEKLIPRGSGPSAATRARGWFTFTFIGESPSKKVITRISGGDPGYDEASKMLAECGLAVVEQEDELTRSYGALSPVAALGDVLVSRLERRGIEFEVLEEHAVASARTKGRGSDEVRTV
jgi:short subunit dehydrogenase-like uncharacterized protein